LQIIKNVVRFSIPIQFLIASTLNKETTKTVGNKFKNDRK